MEWHIFNFALLILYITELINRCDRTSQVQFAHETYDKNKATKIILVNGRPGINQHEGKEYYYYFDQFGGYSSRFGITRVPSLVYQLGVEKVLTIQEVKVK